MRIGILVYISGPMTAKHGHTIEENTVAGLNLYLALLQKNIPAFCPHLSAAFPSALALSYELWIEYDLRVIDHCSHVLMMPRWLESTGALQEHAYAVEVGKPIAYDVEDLERQLGA